LAHLQAERQTRIVHGADPDVVLHLPENDVDDPELSIVIPAADEELTVGDFVEWCKEGLEQAGIVVEIVIVDSSHDRTADLAIEHGVHVLVREGFARRQLRPPAAGLDLR